MNAAITATPRAGSQAPNRVPVAIQPRASWKRRPMAFAPAVSMVSASNRRSCRAYHQMRLNRIAASSNATRFAGHRDGGGVTATPFGDAGPGRNQPARRRGDLLRGFDRGPADQATALLGDRAAPHGRVGLAMLGCQPGPRRPVRGVVEAVGVGDL